MLCASSHLSIFLILFFFFSLSNFFSLYFFAMKTTYPRMIFSSFVRPQHCVKYTTYIINRIYYNTFFYQTFYVDVQFPVKHVWLVCVLCMCVQVCMWVHIWSKSGIERFSYQIDWISVDFSIKTYQS